MKTGIATVLLAALGAIGAILYTSLFVVDQRQQALVIEFGNPQRIVQAPGLQWKKPWQNVMFFDKRLLDFDADAQEVTLGDQRRMVVDAYVRYRIVDPLEFFKTVQTEAAFRQRLGAVVNSTLRNALGQVPFAALLSAVFARIFPRLPHLPPWSSFSRCSFSRCSYSRCFFTSSICPNHRDSFRFPRQRRHRSIFCDQQYFQ
jgi:membrane protease subunit HflC